MLRNGLVKIRSGAKRGHDEISRSVKPVGKVLVLAIAQGDDHLGREDR